MNHQDMKDAIQYDLSHNELHVLMALRTGSDWESITHDSFIKRCRVIACLKRLYQLGFL